MHSTVLHPPNFLSLSPDTIFNVTQRTPTTHHFRVPTKTVELVEQRNLHILNKNNTFIMIPSGSYRPPDTTLVGYNEAKISVSTEKRSDEGYIREPCAPDLLCGNQQDSDRERHRKNQQRYRLKQKLLTKGLDHANTLLADEIRFLKSQRNRLFIGVSTYLSLEAVVTEYFRVFRRGFVEPDGSRVPELDFLRLSMAPDLNTGSAFGFEEIARNWGILGLFFHNVLFKVDDITQITDNVLIAKTTTRMTITARTLREAFLFSTHTVDEGRWLRIVNKLLGQRVVMLGSVRFIWNNSTNLLDGLFSQADLIMPLFQLLGNIEDVSTVLSNARVTPEGNLVVGDYLMQYPLYS